MEPPKPNAPPSQPNLSLHLPPYLPSVSNPSQHPRSAPTDPSPNKHPRSPPTHVHHMGAPPQTPACTQKERIPSRRQAYAQPPTPLRPKTKPFGKKAQESGKEGRWAWVRGGGRAGPRSRACASGMIVRRRGGDGEGEGAGEGSGRILGGGGTSAGERAYEKNERGFIEGG
ncbi:hypothetical protein BS50DRAFT_567858 [Corynespora cassiicola Philippines]|uniref:Uncharacterized protein n=1 Tax=Corynespora cassiicola Philippines TaxID=1448308 RepID=A0A2T2PBV5_CORCC|nr:hypothetical protein BS50DRAFT_567858 [Corynespora cassiicola Philippines]